MRFLTCLVLASGAVGLASPSGAQRTDATRPERAMLAGLVSDSTGAPIPEVVVELDPLAGDEPRRTRTSSDGRFSLGEVAPGARSMQLRRVGYRPFTVTVLIAPSESSPIVIELTPVPVTLGEVRVEGERGEYDRRLTTFHEHMRTSRLGRFVQRDEIVRRGPAYASELLRQVPGAMLRFSGGIGNTVRLRGCRPLVWLDGVRLPGAELDEVAHPQDIAGLEIYTSPGAVPAQYVDRGAKGCGAVVVWTR